MSAPKQDPFRITTAPDSNEVVGETILLDDQKHALGSTGEHVFSDPAVAAYWRGVYENARYESRHRFDPEMTWSAPSERLLKRKVIISHIAPFEVKSIAGQNFG